MRWTRAYVGGYDLSGDARKFGELKNSFGAVDMTGWSDSVKNYLSSSVRELGVNGFSALMNDGTAGAFTVLKTNTQALPLSIAFGGGAAPTYGDPVYLLGGVQTSLLMGFDGQSAAHTADFPADAGESSGMENPLGIVLYPSTSISATTNGTSQDNGAASTNGCHANLHVLATSSGNFSCLVQGSTTGSFAGEETTVITFGITAGSIAADHATASGTIPRYLRARFVRTAGTVTFVVTIARN